ncbi:hypothetical protein L804_00708 [Cryptococcus deuterogattii 2001/935-1]|nr:hypothetical protein L804_00708 [Cryptococcus deuterogattii 2001/935-1]
MLTEYATEFFRTPQLLLPDESFWVEQRRKEISRGRRFATLVVTNGVLNTIADVLMHNPTPQSPTPTYDPYRTLRFAVFGMGMGPIIGRWMRFLERAIPIPAKASLGTAGKGAGGILTGPAGASAGVGKASGEGVQLVKRVVADQTVM